MEHILINYKVAIGKNIWYKIIITKFRIINKLKKPLFNANKNGD